jgi:hypothetical protein
MKKKSKIIVLFSILLLFLTTFIFSLVYIRNISIYEPLTIRFTGISAPVSKLIKINSISPINRENPLQYNDEENYWRTYDGSYHKSIKIILDDSISKKDLSIIFKISEKVHIINIANLVLVKKINTKNQFLLPEKILQEKSVSKILLRIIKSNKLIIIIILLITVSILISLFSKFTIPEKIIRRRIFISWLKIVFFSTIIAFAIFYGYYFYKFFIVSYITSVLFIIVVSLLIWYITIFATKLLSINIIAKSKSTNF